MDTLNSFLRSLGTPYPLRDWFVIVVCASMCGIASVAIAGYLFFGIQTGSLVGAETVAKELPSPVSRAEMKKSVEIYTERAVNYEAKNFPFEQLSDPFISVAKKK